MKSEEIKKMKMIKPMYYMVLQVQRTMLELLNQLDGFEATKNIKVSDKEHILNNRCKRWSTNLHFR